MKSRNAIHSPKNWILNIGLLLTSSFLALLIAELLVRIFVPITFHELHHVDPNNPTRFLPHTRHRYSTSELDFIIQTNRFGRRDNEWTIQTIGNPSNILLIGDSFVLGYGVQADNTIPSLLEARFEAEHQIVELFNFGMAGSISFQEYKTLLNEALAIGIQARRVLIGIFIGNDFQSTDRKGTAIRAQDSERREGIKDPRGRLKNKSYLVHFLKERIGGSPLLVSLVLRMCSFLGYDFHYSPSAHLFLKNQAQGQLDSFYGQLETLIEMKQICDQHNRDLSIIVFPSKIQVETLGLLSNYDFSLVNNRIIEFCSEKDLDCLDLLPGMRELYAKEGEALYYGVDRHFNSAGNNVAAEDMFSFIGTE